MVEAEPSRALIGGLLHDGVRWGAQIGLAVREADSQLDGERLAGPGEGDQLPVHPLHHTDLFDEIGRAHV